MKHPWDQRLGVWWIAEDHPHAPAIAESPSGRTLSFGELAAAAHRVANALRAHGIGGGEVVAYALPNDVDAVVWQLATTEIGLRYLTLNPTLSSGEFASILAHSGASALVSHVDYLDRCAGAAGGATLGVAVGAAPAEDKLPPGFITDAALVADQPSTPPADRKQGDSIRYSSGTTGKPKGIVRTLQDRDPSEAANAMAVFGRAFDFRPFDGAHLVSTGMHHAGCQSFYLGALNVGQALVILGKFDAEQTLAAIDRHPVTSAYMVPTQFVRMVKLPHDVRSKYDVSSLRSVVHSAAPCPLQIKKDMMDWWGPVIWDTYGGTEGAATIAKPHHWLERPGTVGRPVRGMSVKILDDKGNPLPANEIGNVYIESQAGRSFEYRNDAELTDSVHRGNAFTLGDMGYLDDDGYLFICDRAKDMIISGGVNIYPAEVEGVLSSHPAIADVAVIGIPDPEWGEQVKAVVELVAGVAPSDALAEELIAYTRARLAGYKRPRSVDFTARLPRTETGKLLKRQVRDTYWVEAGRRV
ncbi:AMP-binding protein [Mycolicibacterium holsaticum]|uniref:AMP-binding protein n=1 Tax=Mycolicibacterium holsaticum TaxID=152142 RepID=UPI001C7D5117|nr:AMP-binding protein [Mycolicibacterium holsaticum]MDA4108125.1 acyl-CoA synthetase [Mycolicibacterium holsaticum DSM 44478 = JCM 12374]QZA14463.1 AMP-binding protein [Mycolicibacterium holsaticum DSM 44478 = JCM 12374]UNC08088.1 AMP-binding protein [Mycolicibacterium holsaticum DSM 44478 = JCM 12374]